MTEFIKKTFRILIVEDDAEIARHTCRALTQAGYSPTAIGTGTAALKNVRATRPDLVLLDRDLPDMPALDVCRQIKADTALDDIFVVMVCASFISEADQITGLETGADGYIMRPIGDPELAARVEAFVRILRLNRKLRAKNEELQKEVVERIFAEAQARAAQAETARLLEVAEQSRQALLSAAQAQQAATAALREREFWLKESQRVGRIGSYVLDISSNTWTSSEMLDDIFGIEPDSEKTTASWNALVHPDDRAAMLDYFLREVVAAKKPFDREYRIVRPRDRETRWLWGRGELSFKPNSEPASMIGTIQDITERKRAEQKLALSEERFRTLFDLAPDAIFLHDLQGVFVDGNQTAEKIIGHAKAELIGKSFLTLNLLSPEDLLRAAAGLACLARGEATGPDEYVLHRQDGRQIPVEIRTFPVKIDHQTLALGIARDITERKQAQEMNQSLIVAIDQAAESIIFTDLTGQILYVNQGFEKTTGYTRQEALGQHPRLLKSGQQSADYYQVLWETISRGEVWQGHFSNRRKDGTIYEEDATISPIRNGAGKITSYVAVKRDVTRELQLERQVIEAQKMEAIGQLAGGVAHDYNNILAVSVLQLSMLLAEPTLNPDVRTALQDLQKGTERATNLTRQLLLFSRRQAMQKKVVELNALLDDEFKMLRRLLGEHIELAIQAQNGDAWIEADSGMIEQVIMNLCINARDAMPNGGRLTVGIRIEELTANAPLPHVEARPGKYVCLSVQDVGCGMNAATLKRIFEPFFTTKEVGKGTGLGLATVYGIVKQHNGWVEVRSEVGRGTEFRVCLPAAAPPPPNPAASSAPPINRGTETILVVEDEEAVRSVVVQGLKFAGYRVFAAGDGREALQLWQARIGQISLLLTDMIMPGGLNGLELADAFRKLKPALPVVLLSGYSNEIVKTGIPLERGFRFLPKPCDLSVLTAAVRQALDEATPPT